MHRDQTLYGQSRGMILANESLSTVAAFSSGSIQNAPPPFPWSRFWTADKDPTNAVAHLTEITKTPHLESRVYLLAWHCLRRLGHVPNERIARQVKGVVVEVGLDISVESVAAYDDHSARYFNQHGPTVYWDPPPLPDSSLITRAIDDLLEVGRVIASATGPCTGPHPALPDKDSVVINVLTLGGIHVGMGTFDAMFADRLGKYAISGAFVLRQALMELSQPVKA